MTEKEEKEIMNFIVRNTLKLTQTETGKTFWGIGDVSYFVQTLIEFMESQ